MLQAAAVQSNGLVQYWDKNVDQIKYIIYILCISDEEEKNIRRVSYIQATKEERMEVEEK